MFGEQYRPVNPPVCFFYIFSCFKELYLGCKDKITFQDIDCYSRLKRIVFSQYELELIRKMITWSSCEINRLEQEHKETEVDEGQI